jgi:hypothetical protein
MNCDAVQNRLLALPDLRRVPDELRGHLDGCPACRAFLARAARLDGLLAAIPVPPSDEARAAFLDRVTEAGPIIRRVPTVRRRDSTAVDLAALLTKNGRWRYVAALAAAVLVLVGGWLAFRGNGPQSGPEVAGRSQPHKLLEGEVRFLVALSKAKTPDARVTAWADVTTDLRNEVEAVYRFADNDQMKALAGLFDKAAERGLLAQARLARDQAPADRRQKVLREAITLMTRVDADVAAFLQTSPEQAKPHLKQIRETAGRVRAELTKMEPELAGVPPGKGA